MERLNRHNIVVRCWMLFAIFALAGCPNVGNERAEFDQTIGQAATGNVSVSVDNGLAHVRELAEGELFLWAQAPEFSLTLDPGSETNWTIRLRNAMPNARLVVDAPVVEVETELPTEKMWNVTASAEPLRLRVESEIDETQPWRFAVFADVQEKIDDVQDIYDTMRLDPTIRFALISGDLTSQGGADELARFQEEMETLPFPCFATLGNHELGNGNTTFHQFFGRGNFSFEYGGARFTLLDSASATIPAPVWPWIEGWLEEAQGLPHLVIMHIPPLDVSGNRNGGFASRQEANKLLGLFAREGVDLTIYGHVHTYSAYRNAGIPAIISGGGGAIQQRLDGIGRHYLSIDIDPQTRRFAPALERVYPE